MLGRDDVVGAIGRAGVVGEVTASATRRLAARDRVAACRDGSVWAEVRVAPLRSAAVVPRGDAGNRSSPLQR